MLVGRIHAWPAPRHIATAFVFGLAALLLALPAFASAHSGHRHTPGFDGRTPGEPTEMSFGGKTFRYDPQVDEYVARRGNGTVGTLHSETAPNGLLRNQIPQFGGEGPANAFGPGVYLPSNELAPLCRSFGNRIVVLNGSGNTALNGEIRGIVRRANWKISDQSSQSSGGGRVVRMAVDCDGGGQINVYDVGAVGSWESLEAKVDERVKKGTLPGGTGSNAVKYLAFAPASNDLYGQGGPVWQDLRKNRENTQAITAGMAVVYNGLDSWNKHVVIHELMHALGATKGNYEQVNR